MKVNEVWRDNYGRFWVDADVILPDDYQTWEPERSHMGRDRPVEPENVEGLPVVEPVPDDYYEKHPGEVDELEEGESSIAGTRPRFGWQEGDSVQFRHPDGHLMDRPEWDLFMEEEEERLGGFPPPVYKNPFADE